jgi:hypothetical protein
MDEQSGTSNFEPPLAYLAALGVMSDLEKIWTDIFKLGTVEDLMEKLVAPMAETPHLSGDTMARILDEIMDAPAEELAAQLKKEMPASKGKALPPHITKIRFIELAMFETACLFVVQAVQADVEKASEKERWELACEARRRLGMLQGYILGNRERGGIAALAKLGADALHKENREMRQQAYEWLAENRHLFKYDTDAAEALREVVPAKPSTLSDYVKSFKKLNKPT